MLKVIIVEHTPDPEKVVATAARLCYSPCDITTLQEKMGPAQVEKLLTRLNTVGHLSPYEHASFTFGVEGISRACTHQLVRHRIASFSHQSQRYVKAAADFERITPGSIAADKAALDTYEYAMRVAGDAYRMLVDLGIPAEDARFVLPNAAETKIIFSMNARELLNFFALRTCNRAQWEIRAMAEDMLRLVKVIAPLLFAKAGPGCIHGPCPEGEMFCGDLRRGEALFNGPS